MPDEFFVIRALSEGLVRPSPSAAASAVEPGAATRWDISSDGLTYTFHLNPEARWSNGEAVTAEDFIASYRRALNPATLSPKASLFYAVKHAREFATSRITDFAEVGFRAANSHTLVITLERPTPAFLLYAAAGPWIPANPRVVAKLGRAWTKPGNYVGNGPFVLTEWRANQRIAVRRNPQFHDAPRVKVDGIDFLAFDSGDTEERAYRAGQIDVTMSVPPTKLEPYTKERPDELHRAPLAETRYLSFNTTRAPLADPRVRRALSLAIDRRQIVDRLLRGGHQPAHRFISPLLFHGKTDPNLQATNLRTDIAEAQRLLAEAGFPQGAAFPKLELSTWAVGAPVTEAIQQMWKRNLGIDVVLVTREAKVHVAALREGNYDIGFITAIPDVPDPTDALDEFTTGGSGNYPHWADGEYDRLIQQAMQSTDRAQQESWLHEAEHRLLDQAPLAPLYFNQRNWLMSKRVHGWQYDLLWTRFYLDVYLDQN